MLDNQLFKIILELLDAGLASLGQSQIETQQNYQSTQQGANTGPTIYVYKIGPDTNIGWPERSTVQSLGQSSFRGSIAGNVLTVRQVTAGSIKLYQGLTGAGLPAGLCISSFETGTGGSGTYLLNQAVPAAVALQQMATAPAFVRITTQQKASKFQATALATQDPAATESLTASDIANLGCFVMQSVPTIQALEAQGMGILYIPDVRNPYFTDDRLRYEASPSFDFTLTHKQTIILSAQVITETVLQVLSV